MLSLALKRQQRLILASLHRISHEPACAVQAGSTDGPLDKEKTTGDVRQAPYDLPEGYACALNS